uniref:C-type lectin domain-containing protein n=1 Tax=Acrobeloides nanus TaxID=290746 RepID=A0A914EA29_9BILA
MDTQSGQWFANICDNKLAYICETNATSSNCPTAAPKHVYTCDSEWTFFSGSNACYKVHVENLTWSEAQQVCNTEGANLTSIHNDEENQFIIRITQTGMDVYDIGEPWIGLSSLENDGISYTWVDGTPVDYTNWGPNRPGNPPYSVFPVCYITSDNCIGAADFYGHWIDTEVYRIHRAFICKKLAQLQ